MAGGQRWWPDARPDPAMPSTGQALAPAHPGGPALLSCPLPGHAASALPTHKTALHVWELCRRERWEVEGLSPVKEEKELSTIKSV